MKKLHSSGAETSHRTEKETTETKKTVNTPKRLSPLRRLPDRKSSAGEQDALLEEILRELGDRHSRDFYRLVAAKVPGDVIYQTLAEINADGARAPAKAFTYRMNQWALAKLKSLRNA